MFVSRFRMLTPLKQQQNYVKMIEYIGHSYGKRKNSQSSRNDQQSEEENVEMPANEEKNIEPDLRVMTEGQSGEFPSLKTKSVVPGKGPPPEPPITCCMSGCANCVWILYAEELKAYYGDGGEKSREALDLIEDPSLKAFIKLELGLK